MSTFNLTEEEFSYLSTWMSKVSRSFAVVVSALEEPLKSYLAAAYLICRVIDNIEDCTSTTAWKKIRFSEISQLLIEPKLASKILPLWDIEEWPGLTQDEKNLMSSEGELPLWEIYFLFPEEIKRILRYWSLQMIDGMSHLHDSAYQPIFVKVDDIQLLSEEQDYNHYCYIVAGTVGNLTTDLVILHYKLSDPVAKILLKYCQACGRGLQKTNIIKDFLDDITRGICYLPNEWLSEVDYTPLSLQGASSIWKRKVLVDVLAELKDATEYTIALPYEAVGYRMASLLCLLPALQTILLAAQNQRALFTAQHPSKISHETFAQCIVDARKLIQDNLGIVGYFQQLENKINLQFDGYIT